MDNVRSYDKIIIYLKLPLSAKIDDIGEGDGVLFIELF